MAKRKQPPYTKLTLDRLRKDGYEATVVEKWNAHCGIRQDLFGFLDVLAIKPGVTLGVQATSAANHAARVRKIKQEKSDIAKKWILAMNSIEVWSWKKNGRLWVLRTAKISLCDLMET